LIQNRTIPKAEINAKYQSHKEAITKPEEIPEICFSTEIGPFSTEETKMVMIVKALQGYYKLKLLLEEERNATVLRFK